MNYDINYQLYFLAIMLKRAFLAAKPIDHNNIERRSNRSTSTEKLNVKKIQTKP